MESYVVTEEELKGLVDEYDYNEPNIDDFLKTKQPVELIASREVEWEKKTGCQTLQYPEIGYEVFKKYVGTKVDVYIHKEAK